MARYSFKIPTLAPDDFAALAQKCNDMLRFLEIPIAGWDGSGEPVFNNHEIVFNGKGEACGDSFYLSSTGSNGIIQTYGHDYDLAVRCCLTIFKEALREQMKIISTIPEDALEWIEADGLVSAYRNQTLQV
jgi:hypothetical protein